MRNIKLWNRCLDVAVDRGFTVGYASHLFKDRCGEWPSGMELPRYGSSQWKWKARYWLKRQREEKEATENIERNPWRN